VDIQIGTTRKIWNDDSDNDQYGRTRKRHILLHDSNPGEAAVHSNSVLASSAYHRTKLSRRISVPVVETNDRRLDRVDRDALYSVVVTRRGRDDAVSGTQGCSASGICGPKYCDHWGPETRRQLHRPRVVSHQHTETRRGRRETSYIHIRTDHRNLVLSIPAEFLSERFLAGSDHDHRFAPQRTQPSGEFAEVTGGPALYIAARGCRREADSSPTIDSNTPDRRCTLMPEARGQTGVPRRSGRLKSENGKDRVGIMDLVATAIDPAGRRQQNPSTLTPAAGAPASTESNKDLPSRSIAEGDTDLKSRTAFA